MRLVKKDNTWLQIPKINILSLIFCGLLTIFISQNLNLLWNKNWLQEIIDNSKSKIYGDQTLIRT